MERYLNLQDPVAIADFMLSVIDFLPAKDRKLYEQAAEAVHGGERLPKEHLAEMAKNIAGITWPARRALDHFLKTIGSELEWEAVITNVRPATALLLKRLRKNAGTSDLESTLAHPDAGLAIHSEQEIEINMVRDEARIDLFETHKDALAPMIEEALVEFEAIKKRLKKIREQVFEMKGAAQDTLLARLEDMEDRVYFGGEAPALEALDAELQFDREEAALPSSD
ncbi:hypothetical protein IT407_02000 [Candidatus Uhrbacteria bacterium]|nr:hypothetical protein [Candidatus Uhrbacteria bacterium]